MRVPVRNMAGESIGEIDLRDDVFGIEPNEAVMHQAVVRQMANARLGTHDSKTRGEVRGGGRKPWRQKGTGRARQGTTRAPHWKGGGVVFGPTPRSYAQKMNRKMRQLALRSALSSKVADEQVLVLDSLDMNGTRTKEMAQMLSGLSVASTALILLPEANTNVEMSARNLPQVKTARATCLSVRDILRYDCVILLRESVDLIHGLLGGAE
ncbi:MAG: 50S ribosomal protein L4 [Anaerolineae bacterium]